MPISDPDVAAYRLLALREEVAGAMWMALTAEDHAERAAAEARYARLRRELDDLEAGCQTLDPLGGVSACEVEG